MILLPQLITHMFHNFHNCVTDSSNNPLQKQSKEKNSQIFKYTIFFFFNLTEIPAADGGRSLPRTITSLGPKCSFGSRPYRPCPRNQTQHPQRLPPIPRPGHLLQPPPRIQHESNNGLSPNKKYLCTRHKRQQSAKPYQI